MSRHAIKVRHSCPLGCWVCAGPAPGIVPSHHQTRHSAKVRRRWHERQAVTP